MEPIATTAIKQLFSEARSFSYWLQDDVSDQTLYDIYETMKWGPTSANSNPARIIFVKRGPAREKLIACLMPQNVEKVNAAPVTAIIAQDEKFYDFIPKLYPRAASYREMFAASQALAESTSFRNSSLQGGYFIIAARALGLDCGPMSGFDNGKLDKAFFMGTSLKSNFICNLGYGDKSRIHPRLPRLTFDEACKIV